MVMVIAVWANGAKGKHSSGMLYQKYQKMLLSSVAKYQQNSA